MTAAQAQYQRAMARASIARLPKSKCDLPKEIFQEKIGKQLNLSRMEEDKTAHLPEAVTPKRDVIRVACGSVVCVVQHRPGKTGLKIEMRRFDVAREEFVVSSSLILKGAHSYNIYYIN